MRHVFTARIGQVGFRVGSDWRAPVSWLRRLYAGLAPVDVPDFTVRLHAARPWRRWVRPQVAIDGDLMLPDAVPLPLAHGLLAAEMAMNLQIALGWRRHLLLHAAVVAKDGRAVVLTGESGAGKSTLSALMMARGWRFMGDEFAFLSPETGLLTPHPRLVSLKNQSIAAVATALPEARWGPLLRATPKGDIRHLVPLDNARADTGDAVPAAVIFPRFGEPSAARELLPSEAFARLTQASTNYHALGEPGFCALTGLVTRVPAIAIDYPDGEAGAAAVEAIWARG